MKIRVLTVIVMLIILAPAIKAQMPDRLVRFNARIVADDSTSTPLRDCHIINESLNVGTVSNQFGDFTITANRHDTLMFSILGYERMVLVVTDSMYYNNRIIRLKPKVYELAGATIGRFPGSYDRFKQNFLNEEFVPIPDLNFKPIKRTSIPLSSGTDPGFSLLPSQIHPVTLLYNWLSREGRQMRYFQSLLDGSAEHLRIGRKFNGDLVHLLTGLKDDELVQFMSECHFSKEYLLYVPQEDINLAIKRKFKEYQAAKKQKP